MKRFSLAARAEVCQVAPSDWLISTTRLLSRGSGVDANIGVPHLGVIEGLIAMEYEYHVGPT